MENIKDILKEITNNSDGINITNEGCQEAREYNSSFIWFTHIAVSNKDIDKLYASINKLLGIKEKEIWNEIWNIRKKGNF